MLLVYQRSRSADSSDSSGSNAALASVEAMAVLAAVAAIAANTFTSIILCTGYTVVDAADRIRRHAREYGSEAVALGPQYKSRRVTNSLESCLFH